MRVMSETAAVVILGGGVAGFSVCYYLAKEGIPSVVIEMDSIASKASGKSCGLILPPEDASIFFPSYIPPWSTMPVRSATAWDPLVSLNAESWSRFQELPLELKEGSGIDIQWGESPALYCAMSSEDEQLSKSMIAEANTRGLGITWLGADEVRALDNTVTNEVRGAILVSEYQVEPYRYTLALAQTAENLGASIRNGEAIGFDHNERRVNSVILSTDTKISAEIIVVAMGPWSSQAGSWLGAKIPLKPILAQALKVQVPEPLPMYKTNFTSPAGSKWSGQIASVLPKFDRSVLLGYTEESPETWDDTRTETWREAPTEEMRDFLITGAVRLRPIMSTSTLVEARAAILGYSPDEWPILGRLPGWDNVYTATGMGTLGITLSPAVGRVITDFIVGGGRAERAAEQMKSFEPDRFL